MPDARLPVQHALILRRVEPDRGMARFYALMVERDLFGTIRLARSWGRIGTNGRELAEVFATEIEAGAALEAIARVKRRRGYRDL
jgi:predicted DNA-binding WGR domain protein